MTSSRYFDGITTVSSPDRLKRSMRSVSSAVKPAAFSSDSFIGQVFALVGRTMPPPAGVKSPALWGTVPHCEQLFQGAVTSFRSVHREFTFRYLSAAHFIEVFRTFYGPIHKLYGALSEEKAAAFTSELTDLIERFNRSGDDTVVIPSKYLELVIHRR